MASPITFYFDFNSTFSYIAIHRIDALAAKYGRDVDWRVISLGHLFNAQNIVPPPTIPAKFTYLARDFERSCAFAGLSSALPKNFPPDVKFSRLMFYKLKEADDALARTFAKTIATAIFGRGEEVVTPEQIASVCRDLPDITVERIQAAATESGPKRALIASLEAAIADGMVGAPYFMLDGEPFWGADRMDHLERRLAEAK